MKNKFFFQSVFFLIAILLTTSAEAISRWRRIDVSFNKEEIRGAILDARDGKRIFVMTSSGLYVMHMTSPLRTTARLLNEPVNDVFITGPIIFIATDQGLFSSKDSGRTWRQEIIDRIAYDVTAEDDKLFLATSNGVYMRSRTETLWHKMPGILGREDARRLVVTEDGLFILTRHALYLHTIDQTEAKKVFTHWTADENDKDSDSTDEEDSAADQQTELVDIFTGYEGLYLAAKDGLFVSRDGGLNWQPFCSAAEIAGDLSAVVSVIGNDGREIVCVGSSKGAACGRDGRFTTLYDGMEDIDIHRLSVMRERGLIATTRHGVYTIDDVSIQATPEDEYGSESHCVFKDYAGISDEFAHEPTVREVQAWAVDYAEANKAKIDSWRRQAREKALLPSVSLGVDRASGELFHWDTGPNPDVLQKGRSYANWDVRFTWQLSDIVWSSDQTSIDSRSKLMVELREQVIDQVTRIYFERRRLQVELSACAYSTAGDRMAVEMRVDELTALLDGYTGGVFSKRINGNSFNHQPRRNNV